MKRMKLLIENILIYGLGSIIGKIIPLVMLPIIVRLMPNSSYVGINDIATSISSFAISFAIFGMYDAMFRLFFEREEELYKKEICATAFAFVFAVAIIIALLFVIFRNELSEFFMGTYIYSGLFYIVALHIALGPLESIISAPTRMQNKRIIFLVINAITPIISYSISYYLLRRGFLIIGLMMGTVSATAFSVICFAVINHKWFSIKNIRKKYLIPLLQIAIPLLPMFMVYWIFNASDRIMIGKMIGNEEVGIYSVGAKLGQVSQLIYTAFASGWQYFAFATMKDNDQVKMTSKIFECMTTISVVATIGLASIIKIPYQMLFKEEYWRGIYVVPYLFLAPLLLMVFQIMQSQFMIIKKVYLSTICLAFGAAINVAFNFYLIPKIGIEGAAIGTLGGYLTSIIICAVLLCKMKLLEPSKKIFLEVFIMVMYITIWRIYLKDNVFLSIVTMVIALGIIVVWNIPDILLLINKIKDAINKNGN